MDSPVGDEGWSDGQHGQRSPGVGRGMFALPCTCAVGPGLRPIHSAILNGSPDMLELLLKVPTPTESSTAQVTDHHWSHL